jgi:hypothetical protein
LADMVKEWVDFVVNEAVDQPSERPLALEELQCFRNREVETKRLQRPARSSEIEQQVRLEDLRDEEAAQYRRPRMPILQPRVRKKWVMDYFELLLTASQKGSWWP